MVKEFAGKTVEVDAEGFLKNPADWDKDIAVAIAKEEGIDNLSDDHWRVIEFIRKDHQEKGTAPTIRRINKAGNIPTRLLYELFPNGPAKKAAKISGLGKPQGCV